MKIKELMNTNLLKIGKDVTNGAVEVCIEDGELDERYYYFYNDADREKVLEVIGDIKIKSFEINPVLEGNGYGSTPDVELCLTFVVE